MVLRLQLCKYVSFNKANVYVLRMCSHILLIRPWYDLNLSENVNIYSACACAVISSYDFAF